MTKDETTDLLSELLSKQAKQMARMLTLTVLCCVLSVMAITRTSNRYTAAEAIRNNERLIQAVIELRSESEAADLINAENLKDHEGLRGHGPLLERLVLIEKTMTDHIEEYHGEAE